MAPSPYDLSCWWDVKHKHNNNSWSITQSLELKVDREHYPLMIAVRLNLYQYGYKAVQILSVMRLEPVTTSLRVLFASHYTIKVVARSCRFLCLDSFSSSVQLVTQCTLLYTVSLVFSH